MYARITGIGSNLWMIGKIEDHTARPLSIEEIDVACDILNAKADSSREDRLKLFIWTDFSPDYTGGLAVAIAKDVEEAQKLIVEHRGFEVYNWGDLHVYPLKRKMAECVSGGG